MEQNNHKQTEPVLDRYLTPISVVLGALLVAGAIYYGDGGALQKEPVLGQEGFDTAALEKVAPVSDKDHIRGSKNAIVTVIEYSDTECPFCKRFHETMKRITTEYGGDTVAWVYRHYPLDVLHKKARGEAIALECAAELGGNDAFWRYLDRLFEVTPSNDRLDVAQLPVIATYAGVEATTFSSCLTSGRHDARIDEDIQNAIATGGAGTPWSVVIGKGGKKYVISGAQPYEVTKAIIEAAIKGQ